MSTTEEKIEIIKQHIGAIPDFPKPGILFRDIFPVLRKPDVFGYLIDVFVDHIQKHYEQVDVIVGLEARGFIIGPLVALRLGCAFVPIRKAGKLPGKVIQQSYQLEYGEDTFEIQADSITPGQNVVIIDDLLATGGTMCAACTLVKKLQGHVRGCLVVIELPELCGRLKVSDEFHALVQFKESS